MLRNTFVALASLAVVAATASAQQEAILAEYYGNGVHRYFAGDYEGAQQYLQMAASHGSEDPRVFYFLGLTTLQVDPNNRAAAQALFAKGAEYEGADANRSYNVGRSMERVQGRSRLMVESHRAKARLAAYELQKQRSQARYEQRRNAEPDAIRNPKIAGPVAPEELTDPSTDTPATSGDPFTDDPMQPGAGDEDPFGGAGTPVPGPMPPAGGATDDPFGAGTPAPQPMGGATDDPFGGAAPGPMPPAGGATDDPFGAGTPAPQPMPPAGGASDDPFGAAAPGPAAPADPMPPAGGGDDDPFGAGPAEMKSDDGAAADDPFGD